MSSENDDSFWFTNLCNHVTALCTNANDIIPQEPVEYVRNQFLTASESIRNFYTEFVDSVVNTPILPKQDQNCSVKLSSMAENTDLPDDHETKSDAVNFSSSSSSNEPVGKICIENEVMDDMGNNNSVQIVEEADYDDAHANLLHSIEYLMADFSEVTEEGINSPGNEFYVELPDDEVISTDTQTDILPYPDAYINGGEAPYSYVESQDEDMFFRYRLEGHFPCLESFLASYELETELLDHELIEIPSDSESDSSSSSSDEYISAGENSDYCTTEPSEGVVDISDYEIENEDSDDEETETEQVTWDEEDLSDSDWEFV